MAWYDWNRPKFVSVMVLYTVHVQYMYDVLGPQVRIGQQRGRGVLDAGLCGEPPDQSIPPPNAVSLHMV